MNRLKRLIVLLALAFIVALVPAGTAQAKKPLRGTMELYFQGHLGILDGEGRLYVWGGTISGDIDGTMLFWAVPGTPDTGQVHHFEERWEIWAGEQDLEDLSWMSKVDLLLAGYDKGTSTIRHGKNSNYRMNGEVTEASPEWEHLIGRHVHMSGHITWAAPGLPATAPGTFRVN